MNKIDASKMYSKLILLSWCSLLFCLVLKLFGVTSLIIPEFTYNINIWVIRLINLITYEINSLFYLIILIKRKPNIKELLITFSLSLLPFTAGLFVITQNYKMIVEFIMYIVIGLLFIKDKWYKIIAEVITITIIFILFQLISMSYKCININIITNNVIKQLILSIDLYIMFILLSLNCLKKGGQYIYERGLRFLVVLSKRRRSEKNLSKTKENVQESIVADKTTNELGYKIFAFILALSQFIIVGVLCYLINQTIINYIIIFVSFCIMRKFFVYSYHCKTIIGCTTLSCFVFVSLTRLSMPMYLSTLLSVCLGLLLAYIMYIIYYHIKYTSYSGITIEKGMNKDNLMELCQLNNLGDLETNILIDFYCNKLKLVNISIKYNYSVDNINKLKKKALNKIRN